MIRISKVVILMTMCISFLCCNGQITEEQKNILSDDFDQSQPFYYKMPKNLSSTDTSPGWDENEQKILLTGTVYEMDGKTPAPNIIMYYHQTNANGIYATKVSEERNMPKNKLGQTHGYIRGWLKTDKQGKYSIYTTKPGTYPSRDEPSHIHLSIKEKNMKTPYYVDDFVFDDDPMLNSKRRKKMENRGGSGVIRFVLKGDLWIGERNIVLGLNIPEYPKQKIQALNSGKKIGEDILSFTPFHAFGADKNTKTCPICKYGWFHGVLYFVGNNPNWNDIKKWLTFLDKLSIEKEKYLKVYFVYGNENNYDKNSRINELEKLGIELDLKKVALTFVSTFTDKDSDIYLNKINPSVKNTFLIYKRSNIIDKFINLEPSQQNFNKISNRIEETTNEYLKLSKPKKH